MLECRCVRQCREWFWSLMLHDFLCIVQKPKTYKNIIVRKVMFDAFTIDKHPHYIIVNEQFWRCGRLQRQRFVRFAPKTRSMETCMVSGSSSCHNSSQKTGPTEASFKELGQKKSLNGWYGLGFRVYIFLIYALYIFIYSLYSLYMVYTSFIWFI